MCEKWSPDLGVCMREAGKAAKFSRTAQAFPSLGAQTLGQEQKVGEAKWCHLPEQEAESPS